MWRSGIWLIDEQTKERGARWISQSMMIGLFLWEFRFRDQCHRLREQARFRKHDAVNA